MPKTKRDRLLIVSREVKRLRKTIAWALSVWGGLVSLAFTNFGLIIALIVGAFSLLLCLIIIQTAIVWRLTRKDTSEWLDREYLLLKNSWTYSISSDLAALNGECLSERRLICKSGTISSMSIATGPKESLLPFDPTQHYETELLNFSRSSGTVTVRDPHRKEGSSFAFQIDFNPPLVEGEEVYIKYRYKIPKLKMANHEDLLEKSRLSKLGVRDWEYNSFTILYPIQRFEYDLVFLPECMIKPKELDVMRGTDTYKEEKDRVLRGNHFKCENTLGAWRMTLSIDNPPRGATYRLLWFPPKLSELKAIAQGSAP